MFVFFKFDYIYVFISKIISFFFQVCFIKAFLKKHFVLVISIVDFFRLISSFMNFYLFLNWKYLGTPYQLTLEIKIPVLTKHNKFFKWVKIWRLPMTILRSHMIITPSLCSTRNQNKVKPAHLRQTFTTHFRRLTFYKIKSGVCLFFGPQ